MQLSLAYFSVDVIKSRWLLPTFQIILSLKGEVRALLRLQYHVDNWPLSVFNPFICESKKMFNISIDLEYELKSVIWFWYSLLNKIHSICLNISYSQFIYCQLKCRLKCQASYLPAYKTHRFQHEHLLSMFFHPSRKVPSWPWFICSLSLTACIFLLFWLYLLVSALTYRACSFAIHKKTHKCLLCFILYMLNNVLSDSAGINGAK